MQVGIVALLKGRAHLTCSGQTGGPVRLGRAESSQLSMMNGIDSNKIARDAGGKSVLTFCDHALALGGDDPVAARAFGLVEGGVGRRDQFIGALAGIGAGHTRTEGDVERLVWTAHRDFRKTLANSVHHGIRGFDWRIQEDNAEFLASIARDDVDMAESADQRLIPTLGLYDS